MKFKQEAETLKVTDFKRMVEIKRNTFDVIVVILVAVKKKQKAWPP
jgi:hypothetical protein